MTDGVHAGRVWKFGDNIDTDLMMPNDVVWLSQAERARAVFRANRPGWVDDVRPGDAIIAGRNFGMGSSRPAALALKQCGVGFLVCETMNGLFFRNAVNYGLLAFEGPGVTDAFDEGHEAELRIDALTLTNRTSGRVIDLLPVPEMLLALMREGGVFPYMEKQGILRSRPA